MQGVRGGSGDLPHSLANIEKARAILGGYKNRNTVLQRNLKKDAIGSTTIEQNTSFDSIDL